MTDTALFNFDTRLDGKSVTENDDGSLTISGYGSTYLNTDRDGDYVSPGALDDALGKFLNERSGPMLFGHSYSKPLGRWHTARLDGKGLYLEGRVTKPSRDDSYLAEIFNLIKDGAIRGLSIGGRFTKAVEPDGRKRITDIDLYEVSLAPVVINPESSFEVAAQKAFKDPTPTPERNDANVDNELQALRERVAGMAKLIEGRKGLPAGMTFSAPAKPKPSDSTTRFGNNADDGATMRRALAWREERERQERARAEKRRDALLAGAPEPLWETEIPYNPPAGWEPLPVADQTFDLREAITGKPSGPSVAYPTDPNVNFAGQRVASTINDDDILTVEEKFRRAEHESWTTRMNRRLENLVKNQG